MVSNEINEKLINLEIAARKDALALYPAIIDLARKFDGKIANKRFDTALKKIHPKLVFRMQYNSFVINMDIENRCVNNGNHWVCLRDHQTYIIHWSITSGSSEDGICQKDGSTIVGNNLVKALEQYKKGMEEYVQKLQATLVNIPNIINWYKAVRKSIDDFNDTVPGMIRDYYELKF